MPKINKLDKENLRQVILDAPKQFSEGFALAKNIKLKKQKFTAICVSGMGGSSFPADLLRTYVENLYENNSEKNQPLEIIQNKNYTLPKKTLTNCLHIFASYSGNTEETISAIKEAIAKKLPAIGIMHGGKLQELCIENDLPYIILPAVSQPRYASGYFFAISLQLLNNLALIEDKSAEIIQLAKKLDAISLQLETPGKALAKKLIGKTPIVHTTDQYKSLALIWKIKINENAKTPCFWNVYPELNHNEMVGYTLPQGKFHVITLLDPTDNPRILQRMQLTATLLKSKNIATTFFEMPGQDLFTKMFGTLLLGDWTAYYLALFYGQDPTPVQMVEDLKNKLV
ncbi:MAG: bifunctional phosphoglucose/phosphomannose isomerase [Candidatus Moraniibacteriota bacterium]